jgi:NADPH:quinone reductase-like Zn-dependent oxidoreductase
MQAVRLHSPSGPAGLTVDEIATPEPGAGEALVRVHAAAITRDELEWPVDRLPAIPSYELSGVVEAIGPDVTDVAVGDEVYALTGFDRDGVAAELALVRAAVLAPKPTRLGHIEAAAMTLAALSAWQGLFEHGRLREGERVLVTGAAGGVGHFATQLARARGSQVVDSEPDLVFDTAGGDALAGHGDARVVSVAEEAPGVTYFVVEPSREQLVELAGLADDGKLEVAIDSVFPLADARAAFERVAAHGKRGKVVLQVGS